MALKLQNISVVLVEDMAPMRMVTAGLLKSMGVGQIWPCEDGEKAIELIRKNNPDIVITDWHMEPMDGLSLAKAVRTDTSMPNRFVPIIMITGFNAVHRVATARDAGVTEFLIKPFSAQELARRLAYVINKPRDFIESKGFFGPDRRRQIMPDYRGKKKRKVDTNTPGDKK
ncbi:MAG: response regulator [Alphaproteobacteria bacterium]